MTYEHSETYGQYEPVDISTASGQRSRVGPDLMAADRVIGNMVFGLDGEDIGDISDIMLDISSGKVQYAVLSCGTTLGMGEKLFAVPWEELRLDAERNCFVLALEKAQLRHVPGFDKNRWPNAADRKLIRARRNDHREQA